MEGKTSPLSTVLSLFLLSLLCSVCVPVSANSCTYYLGGDTASNDSKTCGKIDTPCDSLATIASAIALVQSVCTLSGTKTSRNLQILVNNGTFTGTDNANVTFSSINSFTLAMADDDNQTVAVFDNQQLGPSLLLSSISNVTVMGNIKFTSGSSLAELGQGCVVIENCETAAFSMTEFSECSSQQNGGGLQFSGLVLQLQNVTFSYCNSSANGGALYAVPLSKTKSSDVVQISIVSSVFQFNTASLNGGALSISSINTSIVESSFQQNIVSGSGGALFLQAPETAPETVFFEVQDSKVFSNVASNGAGMFVDGPFSAIQMDSSSFYSNTASEYGGAISFNMTNQITIRNNNFNSNVAQVAGGALSCFRAAETQVNDTLFSGNAANGGLAHTFDIYSIEDSCGSPFWQICPCNGTATEGLTSCSQTNCEFGTCAIDVINSVTNEIACFCFYQPSCQLWSSDAPVPLDLTWLYVVAGVVTVGLIFVVFIAVILFVQQRRQQNVYQSLNDSDDFDQD